MIAIPLPYRSTPMEKESVERRITTGSTLAAGGAGSGGAIRKPSPQRLKTKLSLRAGLTGGRGTAAGCTGCPLVTATGRTGDTALRGHRHTGHRCRGRMCDRCRRGRMGSRGRVSNRQCDQISLFHGRRHLLGCGESNRRFQGDRAHRDRRRRLRQCNAATWGRGNHSIFLGGR